MICWVAPTARTLLGGGVRVHLTRVIQGEGPGWFFPRRDLGVLVRQLHALVFVTMRY